MPASARLAKAYGEQDYYDTHRKVHNPGHMSVGARAIVYVHAGHDPFHCHEENLD